MSNAVRTRGTAIALTMLACALIAPAGALAGKASIHEVIAKALPGILKAEGHVLAAEGEYAQTKDPTTLDTAIDKSVATLGALKRKVASQSASAPKIKAGKAKVVKGLEGIIVGYGHLKTAFADKASDPTTSKTEAESALADVKSGKKALNAGIALLK